MHQLFLKFLFVGALLGLLAQGSGRASAQACDITIPPSDTPALIAAVAAANANPADESLCLTGSTYTFASNEVLPVISGNTVIVGDGAHLDASSAPANSSYAYVIDTVLAATLTVEDLTITGRVVRAAGPLNLTGVTLTGSQLDTNSTTFIDGSVLQNGKAYISRGHTTITDTDFIGNYSGQGAAIDNRGNSLTISDSRFIGNSTSSPSSEGGAIKARGILNVTDSLFENNVGGAHGGAIYADNTTTITRSVFRGNTLTAPTANSIGAIAIKDGALTLTESCILDNRPAAKSVGYISANLGSTARNNWWGVETGPGTGTPLVPVDATNLPFSPHLIVPPDYCPVMQAIPADQTLATAVDTPLAITLTTWGGRPPYTYDGVGTPAHGALSGTIPTLLYTPDAGYEGADEFTFQTTDDDGTVIVARVLILVGDAAYPPTIPVTSAAQEVPFVENGNCTLGEAIQAASTNAPVDACPAGRVFGMDVIDLPADTYTMTAGYFTLEYSATALPRVVGRTHLNGNGSTITRGGAQNMRFLYVDPLGVLSIEDATFSNGRLDNNQITGRNHNGGAIYVDSGQLTVEDVTFTNNFARNGGAIASKETYQLTTVVRSSTFAGNSMGGSGGAILGAADIADSLFEDNISLSASSGSGGALYGRMVIDNSIFRGNRASIGGAALLRYSSAVTGSLFEDNASNLQGGALYLEALNQHLTVSTSNFRNNVTLVTGSAAIDTALPSATGFISISESCFYGNTANAVRLWSGNLVEARNNWWGHSTGPVVLPDVRPGQTINSTSRFQPHKTAPLPGCEVYPPDPGNQAVNALYLQPTPVTLTAANGMPPYTIALAQPPAKGTLSGTIPTLTYTTDTGVFGSDSFTFTATNSTGETATGTITINITSDIAAADQAISVPHDAGTPITLGATGGVAPLAYSIATAPQHGALTGTPPDLIYTPAFPYSGADSFTFTVTDQGDFSDTGTVSIAVVNPLVASDQTVYGGFDTPNLFVLSAASPYPPLAYSDITAPAHGTLSGTPPNLTYTPDAGWAGTDSFSYSVSDTAGFSDSATVTVQTAPKLIVKDIYAYTRPATPRYINLTPSGGRAPYTYDIPVPAQGAFTGTLPWVYYIPDAEYVGADGTTYTVTDANGTSSTAALKISTGLPLDAVDLDVYTPYETAIFMVMQARGGYGPYAFSVKTPPAHGTLIGFPPFVLYLSAAGYSGTDRIDFTATDSEGFPATGYIHITVGGALVLPEQALEAVYETPMAITLAPTGGTAPYAYALLTPPAHGALTGAAPDLVYTPDDGYSGADSFVYRVTDRFGRTDEGAISIAIPIPITVAAGDTAGLIAAIIAANATPQHDTILLAQGEYAFAAPYASLNALPTISKPLTIRGAGATLRRSGAAKYRMISVNGVKVTLDGLTFADGDVGTSGWGGAILNDGALTVIGATFVNNRAGALSGVYYGGAIANRGTLTVTNSTFTGNFSVWGVIASGETDMLTVTGSTFTDNEYSAIYFYAESVSAPRPVSHIHGSCFVGNGHGMVREQTTTFGKENAIVLVSGNWWGAYDGPENTLENSLIPSGHGDLIVNDYDEMFLTAPPAGCGVLAPVVADESLTAVTARDRAIALAPEGGLPPYSYSIDVAPQHGMLTGTAPNLVYTSQAGYTGPDSLTYTAYNSAGGTSASATISLTLQPPLTPGRAYTTERNTEIAIPISSDDGQPPFSYTELTQPEHGYVGQTDTTFYYIPDLDYVGADSFSYRITDGLGDSVIETVSITVTPRAPATIVVDTTATEDSPFVLNGNCTIGEAFSAAATNMPVDACAAGSSTGIDIIDLPEGTFTRLTDASWSALPSNSVLRGAGMGKTILTAAPTVLSGILRSGSGTRTVQELTLRGGRAIHGDTTDGGALNNAMAHVTARLVHFDGNRAWHQGGAIYSGSGSLYIVSSIFTTNDSTYGAGIRAVSPTAVTILHSAFKGNIAATNFHAFYLSGPATAHLNCILEDGTVNESITDLRYNYGGSDAPTLTSRPPICDYVIDTPEPTLDISVAAGDTAGLIAAIEQVNAFGRGKVWVADGEYVLTVPYAADPSLGPVGLPPITGDLEIYSPHGTVIRRDNGAAPFRSFTVDGGSLALGHITLANGLADTAAAIHVDGGSLSLWRSRFENNTSALGGAVVVVADGDISSSTDVFIGNTGGAHIGAGASGVMRYGCYLYNSGAGITNDAANPLLDGTANWWDSVDGPSGAGSGHGDPVGPNVDFSAFKTARPVDCPIGRVHVFDQSAEMLTHDGSTLLTLVATGGDGAYTFVTGAPAHGTLTGSGATRTYTPDAGYIGDDTFTVTATDGGGRSGSGTFTVTVRLAEITVDSVVQEVPFVQNGNCTLGEAIAAANTDSAVDGCAAGSGRDTIVLQAGAAYTLTAVADTTLNATGLPPITSDIAIDGRGATIARDSAAPDFRLLAVDLTGTLRLNALTLTGGRLTATSGQHIGGGAVYVRGTLYATDVTAAGNTAAIGGGLRLEGFATIRDSLISGNTAAQTGGGAYVCGNPAATARNDFFDTDFTGNAAANGGGAIHYRCRPMTMTGGLIANNGSPFKGASIYAEPHSSPYVITLTGVVIEDNLGAQGSVYAQNGVRLTISDSCILENAPTMGIISTADYAYYDVEAAGNWWGSSTGTRYGTAVSGFVTTTPHLTAPILGCGIRPPSAVDMTLNAAFETPLTVTLTGVDGTPPYAYAIETEPSYGTLSGTAPDLIYTPAADYSGSDSFTFTATDALGASDRATVTVNVAADLSAQPAFFETAYDTPVTVYVTPVGGRTPYTLSVVAQPQFGALAQDGTFIYTPPAGFTGTDMASIRITDANGDTYDAGFNIEVGAQLAAVDQAFAIDSGGAVTFRLWATGGTPGSLMEPTPTPIGSGYNYEYIFSQPSAPQHGTLYSSDGIHWTYIADAGFVGYETLTFTVTDLLGATDDGLITIEVKAPATGTPGETLVPTITLTPSYTTDPCTYFTPTPTRTPFGVTPTQSGGGERDTPCVATYTPTPVTTDEPTPVLTLSPSLTPSLTPSHTPTFTTTPGEPGIAPSQPQLLAPLPDVLLNDAAPSFSWAANPGWEHVQWYRLVVKDADGKKVLSEKLPAAACAGGTCHRDLRAAGDTLPNGAYTWYVQAKNSVGKTVSAKHKLSIVFPPPAALIEPAGGTTTSDRSPLFSWSFVEPAAQYRLVVKRGSQTVLSRWLSAAAAGCGPATCSIDLDTLGVTLPRGKLRWRVDTRNKPLGPSVTRSGWQQLTIMR